MPLRNRIVKTVTDFEGRIAPLLLSDVMFAVATASLLTLVQQLSGTPYISGGDSPRGTDCSGLVSFVTNAATGRPVYGDRFNTGNIEGTLKAGGFQYGTKPGALNVGWNRGHTAATLPDGTPVSSGEGGEVRVGGGCAYQSQFAKHMYLELAPAAPTPDEQLPPGMLPRRPTSRCRRKASLFRSDSSHRLVSSLRLRLSCRRLLVRSCRRLPLRSCRRLPVPSSRRHSSHKRHPRRKLRSRPAANTRQLA